MSGSSAQTDRLRAALAGADAVVIGAGAGLSTFAGFVYTGERFEKYFSDFAAKYNFHDMYSGGFYPYATLEEHWAYWSRSIYINRYLNAPKPVYEKLLSLVKDKDSFVLTTNVDHCFQKAGFDKHRLFHTQGDYGLFQCSEPCRAETFDNGEIIQNMVTAQGYTIAPDGTLTVPEAPKMAVPDSGSSFWSWVWGTTPRHHQVPLLAHDGREPARRIRLPECGGRVCAGRYQGPLRLHRRRPRGHSGADLKKTRRTSSVFFVVHITAPRSDSGACRDSFFRIQSPMWDSSRYRPCSGCRPCPRRVCRPAG